MFLIASVNDAATKAQTRYRFNPLNQVYVFNWHEMCKSFNAWKQSFNPLNQVYVFNVAEKSRRKLDKRYKKF